VKSIGTRGVEVRFGKTEALAGVDFSMSPGETTMLIGPNGAGKSTLMGVMLGLVRPNGGHLVVDGATVEPGPAFRKHLGYLPEHVAFSKNLTAKQVLRFFARARGVPMRRVPEVLERVSLDHAAARAVRGFSRGMLQRLGLAAAILHEPELLILDEPSGGLDQQGLEVLWDLLSEWRQKGRFLLMASHELTLLETRVDRITLLAQGRIEVEGTTDSLRLKAALPVRVQLEFENTESGLKERDNMDSVARELGAVVLASQPERLDLEVSPDRLRGIVALQADAQHVQRLRVEEPGFDQVYGHLLEASAASPEAS
jgi:Cu-processing system ATP-binding protein